MGMLQKMEHLNCLDKKIYFDNGSTSFPKAPGVAEAVAKLLEEGAFNINRGNYEGAYEVASVVLETRELLADLFHAKSATDRIWKICRSVGSSIIGRRKIKIEIS